MGGRKRDLRNAERLSSALLHLTDRWDGAGEPEERDELASPGPSWRKYLQELVCSQTPISVVMSHDAISVGPETSVEGLTAFLLERRLGTVPVINEGGALVGIVSTTDLLREVQERVPFHMPVRKGVPLEPGDGCHGTCIARATVEEIMTPSTFALPDTASVAKAAALMAFDEVSQLPVACSRCKGICIVSALDVMRWLARQSGFVLSPPIAPKGAGHAPIAKH